MGTALRELLIQMGTVIVEIVALIVGTYVIKYLKKAESAIEAKMSKDEYDKIKAISKTVVMAIEQQYPDLKGDKKYEIAFEAIMKKLNINLTEDELKELIEGTVGEMNLVKKTNGN